ncbi:MAG TPA: SPW repeat protein [Aggregatilineales bacterium]|nr:SPW repeat protein [Aggregatilineales bacterium]
MAEQTGTQQARWQDWLNLLLGIWLVISPWVGVTMSRSNPAAVNSYIFGVLVIIFALTAMSQRNQAWEEWLNLIFGLWLILAPFALHFTDQAGAMWNQIVVGIIIGISALWAAVQVQGMHRHA